MSTPAHALTGLNSYLVRLPSGEFIYDASKPGDLRRGYYAEHAQVWLWEPEQAPARVAALAKLAGCSLVAVRSRP